MSLAATEAARERRRRKRLPLEDLVSVQLDELFDEFAKVPRWKYLRMAAALLRMLAASLRRQAWLRLVRHGLV